MDANKFPTLHRVEITYIRYVMIQCNGDKRKAAEVLGISLKTLYNKLHDNKELIRWRP